MPFPARGPTGIPTAGEGDVLFFGTFDEKLHPRTTVLREGLAAQDYAVSVINRPLGLSTADKVRIARFPPLGILLVIRLLGCWVRLMIDSRGASPAIVIVGYMGHFDVHLARVRFRSSFIVLDHLTGLAETAVDRHVDRGLRGRLLGLVDRSALGRADLVLSDTEEQAAQIAGLAKDVVVVPVGASAAWHQAGRLSKPSDGPLKVIFVGLFTPLQGTTVIATAAAQALATTELEFTFVGTGQDLDSAKSILGPEAEGVTWKDWIPSDELASFVASFDVSLGIFGTSPKALRVIPNKVYQGLAANTVVITSDTPPQRRLKAQFEVPHLRLVPPGDATALRDELVNLAEKKRQTGSGARTGVVAQLLPPSCVVAPLVARLAP